MRQVRWKLRGVSYVVSKWYELWSTSNLNKTGVLTTLRKFWIPLYCQAPQTKLNHFDRRWTVNRANNLPQKTRGHPSRKKLGVNFLHLFGFRRLRALANIFFFYSLLWHRLSIGQKLWEVQGSPNIVPKFHKLSPTNDLKLDRTFYPSLFCPSHTP